MSLGLWLTERVFCSVLIIDKTNYCFECLKLYVLKNSKNNILQVNNELLPYGSSLWQVILVHEDYFMLALTHVSNQPHSELDSHKTEARKYSSVNNT